MILIDVLYEWVPAIAICVLALALVFGVWCALSQRSCVKSHQEAAWSCSRDGAFSSTCRPSTQEVCDEWARR